MERARARRWAAGVAFLIGGTLLQLLRQPGVRSWDTIWAEDGLVYGTDILTRPAAETLFRGYAGYTQLLPRLLVLPLRVLPVETWAAYLAIAAATATSLLALAVVHWSRGWIRSVPLRWALAFAMILLPASYFEIQANITNLGWPLVIASFWAIAAERGRWPDTALRVAVVVLAALSTPVVAILIPWAVVVVALRRARAEVLVLGSLLAGLATQFVLTRFTQSAESLPTDPSLVPGAFAVRVLGSLLIGERWLGDAWVDHGTVFAVAVALVVVALVVLGWPSLTGDRRWFVVGGIVTSMLAFAFSVGLRGSSSLEFSSGSFSESGSRYVYVSVLLLAGALVVLGDSVERGWVRALILAQVLVVTAASYGLVGPRSEGPAWQEGIVGARATCHDHGDVGAVVIAVSSGEIEVPCRHL